MSTLFDESAAAPSDASLPPAEATPRGLVKCMGCGGAILVTVALKLKVADVGGDAARGYSCLQAACVRAVAQDLATALIGPLL